MRWFSNFWFPPSKLYLINCLKKMLMELLEDFRPHIIVSQVWNRIQNFHSPCKRPPIPLSTHVWVWRDPITSSFGAIFKVILYLGGRCMENSCFRRRTARIFTNRGMMMPHRPVLQNMKYVAKFAVWPHVWTKEDFF